MEVVLLPDMDSLVYKVVNALLEKKAEDIKVLDIGRVSLVADYFIICTCRSVPHMNSINDAIDELMEENGGLWHKKEGSSEAGWVLHDLSSVIVHVFLPQQRTFYDLERLWRDAKEVDISSVLPELQ